MVQLKQFLVAIRVSQEFIPEFNLKLTNEDNFSLMNEILGICKLLLEKKEFAKLPDSEVIENLKEFRSRIEEIGETQNIILNIKSNKDYPKNSLIYTKRNTPEPVVREYVEDKEI